MDVTSIDSTTLSALAFVHRELEERGHRLVIVNVPPMTMKVLDLSSLSTLIVAHPTSAATEHGT
jgi:anti-anti-sigma factor